MRSSRSFRRLLMDIGFLVMISYGIFVSLDGFLMRKQIESQNVNSFCGAKDANDVDPRFRPWRKELCDMPDGSQFTKFILVITDALPAGPAADLIKHYKDHSLVYGIDVPGLKWSHAIYTTFLTGQMPTNYNNEIIKSDHLLASIIRAMKESHPLSYGNYISVKYIGSPFPVLTLFPEEKRTWYFTGGVIDTENEETAAGPRGSSPGWESDTTICKPFEDDAAKEEDRKEISPRAHPYLFARENSEEFLFQQLEQIKQKKQSLVAYSQLLDSFQHNGETKEVCSWPRLIPRIVDDLKLFKSWVDQNPDYLLILASDHGQNIRQPNFVLHGESNNGNEGFILFYNIRMFSNFKYSSIKAPPYSMIDVVDVCPTIASYLQDVDIPLASVGIARNYYGAQNTAAFAKTIKRNIIQLIQSVEERGRSVNAKAYLSKFDIAGKHNETKHIEDLLHDAESLKKILYQPTYALFKNTFILVSFLILITLLLLFTNDMLFSRPKLLHGLGTFSYLVVIYWGAYINFLFTWPDWKPVYRSGNVFRCISVSLAIMLVYLAKKEPNFELKTLLRNELMNWIIFAASGLLMNLDSYADSTVVSIVLSTLVFLIMKHCLDRIAGKPKGLVSIFATTVLCIELYKLTAGNFDMYWRGIQIFALAALILCSAISIYGLVHIFRGNHTAGALCIIQSLTSLWLLLYSSHFTLRLLAMLANVQYITQVLPIVMWFGSQHLAKITREEETRYSLGIQASAMYAVNQIFFLYANFSVVDLDVNADFGLIGVNKIDRYPNISGFFIAFSKVGLFFIALLHLWMIARTVDAKAQSNVLSKDDDKTSQKTLSHFVRSYVKEETIGIVLSLFFWVMGASLQLLMLSFIHKHAEQECVALTVLFGSLAALYFVLNTLSDIRGVTRR